MDLDGFRDIQLLGRGGSAAVYAATRTADGSEVALKIYERRGDRRAEREASALARLGPPITPRLYTFTCTAAGQPCLVMELVHGKALAAQHGTRMEPAEVVRLIELMARALDRVHAAGVIHRDLKPEHFVLRDSDTVTLLDFGLARVDSASRTDPDHSAAADPTLTRTGERFGTALYMAPEQCTGSTEVDLRADLYALGVIAFELLVGQPPFVGEPAAVRAAHAAQRPPRPSSLVAGLPEAVDAVLLRCLAKDPAQRHASAGAFAAALASASIHDVSSPGERPGSAAAPAASAAAVPAPAPGPVPMALLALHTSASVLELERALAGSGVLARTLGQQVVIAFPAAGAPAAGVRAATRLAASLAREVAVDGPLVVHLASVRARARRGTITLVGHALDQPSSWQPGSWQPEPWPREHGQPIYLTAAAAAALDPSATRPLPAGCPDGSMAGLFEPAWPEVAPMATPPFVGRTELVDALLAHSRSAPGLATVLGDTGLGKSRLLDELAGRLRERGDMGDMDVLIVRPQPTGQTKTTSVLRALLSHGLGLPERALSMAELAACFDEPERSAVALAIGAITADAARSVLRAPGVWQQVAARAAERALALAAARRPLAVLVDDAHLADAASLDALERATMAGAGRLWICVAAQPVLCAARPAWGSRAARHLVHELAPLEAEAARALARELLRPAEFVPEAVLDRLCEAAGRVPLYLVELAGALRLGGLRSQPGADSVYVAADELVHLDGALGPGLGPLAENLAERALAAQPAALVDFAGLCAFASLGDEVRLAEVDAMQEALGASSPGPGSASLDPAVGLSRLAHAGLLVQIEPGRFRFRHPVLHSGVAARVPADRAAAFHRAAYEALHTAGASDSTSLARLARHAAACGASEEAWRAHLAVAQRARRRHDYLEAEQHYTAALAQLPAEDSRRWQALAGRGKVRYRAHRHRDALDDLTRARELAQARGDREAELELLLEQSTVCDWMLDLAGSRAAAEQAGELAAELGAHRLVPRLAARLHLALGRALYRNERLPEAIVELEAAAAEARQCGDYETRVVALLLLAPSLLYDNRLDQAEHCYAEVVALCEAAGDDLHLSAAMTNRQLLWMRRQRMDLATADLRRAIQLARQLGNFQIERVASHNLAELLYWSGQLDEALAMAQRSQELQRRFAGDDLPDDTLLVARVQCSLGHTAAARDSLAWLDQHHAPETLSPTARGLVRLVDLALRCAAEPEWQAAAAGLEDCFPIVDLAIEFFHAAAECAAAAGRCEHARAWLAEARKRAEASRLWQPRLDALARRIHGP